MKLLIFLAGFILINGGTQKVWSSDKALRHEVEKHNGHPPRGHQRRHGRDYRRHDTYADACSYSIGVLRSAREQALQHYVYGEYTQAIEKFVTGLKEVELDMRSNSGKYINRTLNMLDRLQENKPSDKKSIRALAYFLDESYVFLMDHAIRFDRRHYDRGIGHYVFNIASIEKGYIRTSFKYMNKMLESFVYRDRRGNVYPFGHLYVTKEVIELVSNYFVIDLDDSFLSMFYSCEQDILGQVSDYLASMSYEDVTSRILSDVYYDIANALDGRTCN